MIVRQPRSRYRAYLLIDSQIVYHSLGIRAIYQTVCAIIHKAHKDGEESQLSTTIRSTAPNAAGKSAGRISEGFDRASFPAPPNPSTYFMAFP